jgi:hypothetical protein
LTGFTYPLAGGCLPQGDQLMPNAPRAYRNGIHEGIDFYDVDNCTRIGLGTEVLAAKPGRVVRADVAFVDMTQAQLASNLANPNTDDALDAFRGRQVWVQHDGDVITRYAHLSRSGAGITVGASVLRGQVVGYGGIRNAIVDNESRARVPSSLRGARRRQLSGQRPASRRGQAAIQKLPARSHDYGTAPGTDDQRPQAQREWAGWLRSVVPARALSLPSLGPCSGIGARRRRARQRTVRSTCSERAAVGGWGRSRKAAPDFLLETLDDGTLRLSDLRGKPVLLTSGPAGAGPAAKRRPCF